MKIILILLLLIFSIGIVNGDNIDELKKDLNLTKNNTQLYEILKEYIDICKSAKSTIEKATSEKDLANISISNLTTLYYDILFYVSYLDENTSKKIEQDCIKAVDEVLNTTKDRLHNYTEKVERLKKEKITLINKYKSLKEKKKLFENYTALQSEYKRIECNLEEEKKKLATTMLACVGSTFLVGIVAGRVYHSWVSRKAEVHALFSRAKLWQNYLVLVILATAFVLSLVFILLTLHSILLPSLPLRTL